MPRRARKPLTDKGDDRWVVPLSFASVWLWSSLSCAPRGKTVPPVQWGTPLGCGIRSGIWGSTAAIRCVRLGE